MNRVHFGFILSQMHLIYFVPFFDLKFSFLKFSADLTLDLINLKNCSTGAKIGEYGGRKYTFSKSLFIASFVSFDEW